jgi:hypothetical protein
MKVFVLRMNDHVLEVVRGTRLEAANRLAGLAAGDFRKNYDHIQERYKYAVDEGLSLSLKQYKSQVHFNLLEVNFVDMEK